MIRLQFKFLDDQQRIFLASGISEGQSTSPVDDAIRLKYMAEYTVTECSDN